MASFNKVILMGNLVRDPDLRVTPSGLSISKFTVATSRVFKTQDGTQREEATFADVECFGRQAEVVAKYFAKGRPIFLEGRLRLNEWESNTGEKRSKLLVVLENFSFVDSKSKSNTTEGDQTNPTNAPNYNQASPPQQETVASVAPEQTESNDNADEDVPF